MGKIIINDSTIDIDTYSNLVQAIQSMCKAVHMPDVDIAITVKGDGITTYDHIPLSSCGKPRVWGSGRPHRTVDNHPTLRWLSDSDIDRLKNIYYGQSYPKRGLCINKLFQMIDDDGNFEGIIAEIPFREMPNDTFNKFCYRVDETLSRLKGENR